MTPGAADLYAVCEATWPPARSWQAHGVTLRDGKGGGKRVSAATCDGLPEDLTAAEADMRAIGQDPLFMIRAGEHALDTHLAEAGYAVIDPVNLYCAPVSLLTKVPVPPVTCFAVWEPLAIMREIWASGGLDPARLDVMARARTKTGIFARWNERPAGVGFASISHNIAMVHAVEVLPTQRRQGVAQWIMRKSAFWAAEQGAKWISVLCVKENNAANRLYQGLGFAHAGSYHYRIKRG